VASLVVGGTALTLPRSTSGLTATFITDSDWGTGYQGRFTITNNGNRDTTDWSVTFTLPSTAQLGTVWDAAAGTNEGAVKVVARSYNTVVATGATIGFGLIVKGSGAPGNCRINGSPCGGSQAPVTTLTLPAQPEAVQNAVPLVSQPAPPATGAPSPAGSLLVAPYVDMACWSTGAACRRWRRAAVPGPSRSVS
jgi:hypothetical protein